MISPTNRITNAPTTPKTIANNRISPVKDNDAISEIDFDGTSKLLVEKEFDETDAIVLVLPLSLTAVVVVVGDYKKIISIIKIQ